MQICHSPLTSLSSVISVACALIFVRRSAVLLLASLLLFATSSAPFRLAAAMASSFCCRSCSTCAHHGQGLLSWYYPPQRVKKVMPDFFQICQHALEVNMPVAAEIHRKCKSLRKIAHVPGCFAAWPSRAPTPHQPPLA